MGRGFKILAAIVRVLVLTGALAGVGYLDRGAHPVRAPQIYSFRPQQSAPRAVADSAVAVPPKEAGPVEPPPRPDDPKIAEQRAQYEADRSKTIIELQPFRRVETMSVPGRGQATLVDLNPAINAWFLLTLDWGGAKGRASYHLENPDPAGQQLHLADSQPDGIVISGGGKSFACNLWSGKPSPLEHGGTYSLPYALLCDGHLLLRNQVAGHYTDLERMTEFLRDNVWSGETVVGFVRDKFYQDAYRETAAPVKPAEPAAPAPFEPGDALPGAAVGPAYADQAVAPGELGLDVAGPPSHQFVLGRWYPVRNIDGVYASIMQPLAVSGEIVRRDKGLVSGLDAAEAPALDYLTAFDLSQLELRYALGTDHPRVGWSPRAVVVAHNGPGPDGIETATPLVTTGMVSPAVLDRVVATFAGGFKREHGAFKWGDLARLNHGSHYGFVEEGVVFSKLQPGLATLYVLDDGTVQMKTWTEDDDRLLPHIKFARQNGVALVESDADGAPIAGALVNRWGPGNWSGSADSQLRTLRAGICLLQAGGKQFLLHGYFSTATPSAMALVFHAYGCRYAMLLDMNAREHTYLAMYARRGDQIAVQHLISGMADIDRTAAGQLVPRFVGYPDNRDFFYFIRRKSGP